MADNDDIENLESLSDLSSKITKQVTSDANKQVAAHDKVGKKVGTLEQKVKSLWSVMRRGPATLRPNVKELEGFESQVKATTVAVDSLTDKVVQAALEQRKSLAGATAAMKGYAVTVESALAKGAELSKQIDNEVKKFEELSVSIKTADERIEELNNNIDNNIGNMEEQISELTDLIMKRDQERVALAASAQEVEKLSIQYNNQTEVVLRAKQAQIEQAKSLRQVNREMRQMEGGLKALTVPLEEMAESRFFGYLDTILKGGLIVKGVTMINRAVATTGQLYKVQNELARRLGQDAPKGFGSFVETSFEAQKSAQTFNLTAANLGMTLEEVSNIADQIRMGIKVDAQGKLSEAAVRDLTKEVAYFSEITGVEASVATEMLSNRMKNMNMTAEQAKVDLMGMRVQLEQMAVGVKTNLVSMDEMVAAINQASNESHSFVVDTRLMTQALRAAADQAVRMGASQKLAKQTAESFGKAMNTTADFINVPVGATLVEQLMGDDPEKLLRGLTAEQRKFVYGIKEALKAGRIDKYQAGRLLMEQLGNSAAGMEAKMEQIMLTFGNSRVAAFQLVQAGLAENESAAFAMMENWREAGSVQDLIQKKLGVTVDRVELLDRRSEKFAEALKDAVTPSEKLEALTKKMGLSHEDAAEYLRIQSEYAGDAQMKLAKTELFLSEAFNPHKKAEKALAIAKKMRAEGKSVEEIKTKIAADLNITDEAGLENLKKAINKLADTSDESTDQVRDIFVAEQEKRSLAAKKQEEAMSSFGKDLAKGIPHALGNLVTKLTEGVFKGPWADLIGGLSSVLVGGLGLLFGRAAMVSVITTGVAAGNRLSGVGDPTKALPAVTSRLGKFGGKVLSVSQNLVRFGVHLAGATAAFAAGYWIGTKLNAALEGTRFSVDKTSDMLISFVEKIKNLLQTIGLLENDKERADRDLIEVTKNLAHSYRISVKDFEEARAAAKKEGISTKRYLAKKGIVQKEPVAPVRQVSEPDNRSTFEKMSDVVIGTERRMIKRALNLWSEPTQPKAAKKSSASRAESAKKVTEYADSLKKEASLQIPIIGLLQKIHSNLLGEKKKFPEQPEVKIAISAKKSPPTRRSASDKTKAATPSLEEKIGHIAATFGDSRTAAMEAVKAGAAENEATAIQMMKEYKAAKSYRPAEPPRKAPVEVNVRSLPSVELRQGTGVTRDFSATSQTAPATAAGTRGVVRPTLGQQVGVVGTDPLLAERTAILDPATIQPDGSVMVKFEGLAEYIQRINKMGVLG